MSDVKAERRHRALAASTLSAGGDGTQHWVNTGKVWKGTLVDPDLLKVAQAFAEQEAELMKRQGPEELGHINTVLRIAAFLRKHGRPALANELCNIEGTLAVRARTPALDDPAKVFAVETAAGNAFVEWCKEPHDATTHGNSFMSGYVYGVKAMGG